MAFLGSFFKINFWAICWPTALILTGIALLLSPRFINPGQNVKFQPLADVRRKGDWLVENEEIWLLVGDIRLDMTGAEIPVGETKIRTMGFVGDIRLTLPPDVGYRITSFAFLNELRTPEEGKSSTFVSTVRRESEGYQEANRKIHLDGMYFVADIRVRRD
jgi:predicted membrane protein